MSLIEWGHTSRLLLIQYRAEERGHIRNQNMSPIVAYYIESIVFDKNFS